MKQYFLSLFAFTFSVLVYAQDDSTSVSQDSTEFKPTTVVANEEIKERYPYILPIWGQKAVDRGFGDKLQMPFGLNLMYVNTYMDLAITDFSLEIGDNDDLNDILQQIASVENLNFTKTSATANGLNFRADAWLLPFLNTYVMGSAVSGGTNVSLAPAFYFDSTGTVVDLGSPEVVDTIQLEEFGSEVEFAAYNFGIGTTVAYGYRNFFISFDGNYSWNNSELLDQTLGMFTGSGRFGRTFNFKNKNKSRLSIYVGFMYRNFTSTDPSSGNITFNEALPGVQENVDAAFAARRAETTARIDANQANIDANQGRINDINDEIDAGGLKPGEIATLRAEEATLETKNDANEALNKANRTLNKANQDLNDKINEEGGVYDTEIRYSIKKDLIDPWSFEFGFNYEINKRWTFRGEYGVSAYQRLLLTGVSWRFGIKKSNKNKKDSTWFSGGNGWN